MQYDIIIVGDGPAGISAAIYAKRSNQTVLILSRKQSNLKRAELIENYYGFVEPICGTALYEAGIAQAERLGIPIHQEEVLALTFDQPYTVTTPQHTYSARAVILATGISRHTPPIPHLNDWEGKGLSYCAVCDGFFYRRKPVIVIGDGEYALHEAQILSPLASSVTICTNGKPASFIAPDPIAVCNEPIAAIIGQERAEGIRLQNGTVIEANGIFIAVGMADSFAFAKKLGALVENDHIVVNERMETNLPGLYACGDATGGLLQIAKAVYEGAQAGVEAAKWLRKEKH